ncbi:hypothetical protein OKW21_000635 [Catalinimonas alkaloidigena]|nr:hypothetical protein [Catalinimonas alkaloidigena]
MQNLKNKDDTAKKGCLKSLQTTAETLITTV